MRLSKFFQDYLWKKLFLVYFLGLGQNSWPEMYRFISALYFFPFVCMFALWLVSQCFGYYRFIISQHQGCDVSISDPFAQDSFGYFVVRQFLMILGLHFYYFENAIGIFGVITLVVQIDLSNSLFTCHPVARTEHQTEVT